MNEREQVIVDILLDVKEGKTCQQLQPELDTRGIKAHHGKISSSLNSLHKEGIVFYLHEQINNFHIYVHSNYREQYPKSQRIDAPSKNKWHQVADRLYEAMTNIDTTDEQWEDALDFYRKNLK